jgi:hypothetical protein
MTELMASAASLPKTEPDVPAGYRGSDERNGLAGSSRRSAEASAHRAAIDAYAAGQP